jgi:hypothetical protein
MTTDPQRHDSGLFEPLPVRPQDSSGDQKHTSFTTITNEDPTANQRIQLAHLKYLNTRSALLRNFLRQRSPDRLWMENPRDPVQSGNGSVRSDFALKMRLHGQEALEEFVKVLRILYGTCRLTARSDTT